LDWGLPAEISSHPNVSAIWANWVLPTGRLCRVSVPPIGVPIGAPTGAPALPCMPRPERP
jgi:hypothetical protein